jgi:hypothetical protein
MQQYINYCCILPGSVQFSTVPYHTEFARLFPGVRKLILCSQSTSSLLISVLPHFPVFFISDHPHVSTVIILMCGGDGFAVLCELTANLSELMCCLGFGRISVPGCFSCTVLHSLVQFQCPIPYYRVAVLYQLPVLFSRTIFSPYLLVFISYYSALCPLFLQVRVWLCGVGIL